MPNSLGVGFNALNAFSAACFAVLRGYASQNCVNKSVLGDAGDSMSLSSSLSLSLYTLYKVSGLFPVDLQSVSASFTGLSFVVFLVFTDCFLSGSRSITEYS